MYWEEAQFLVNGFMCSLLSFLRKQNNFEIMNVCFSYFHLSSRDSCVCSKKLETACFEMKMFGDYQVSNSSSQIVWLILTFSNFSLFLLFIITCTCEHCPCEELVTNICYVLSNEKRRT